MGRVGVVYKIPAGLSVRQRTVQTYEQYNSSSGGFLTFGNDTVKTNRFNAIIPATYGIGFGLEQPGRIAFALDFQYQDWRIFSFDRRDTDNQGNRALRAAWHVATGVEWIPQANGLQYIKRIAYRLGFRYENTYVTINNSPLTNRVVTFNMGLPLFRQYSRVSFGGAIGQRGSTQNGQIQENYYQLMVGITFNEIWFFKRTYD